MKLRKAITYIESANILSLFIAFTLAVSGKPAFRIASVFCTVGILFCFMAALAVKTAEKDPCSEPWFTGICVSLVPVASWILLCISRKHFPGYFVVHKLLNACFIQIYNLITPSLSSEQLTAGQLAVMGLLSLVPGIMYISAYFFVSRSRK
ncbi:MAG: hypothetical protein J5501_03315 [Ruminococcus sp.]|nr:hypothetical protein [Ruminococcus sp.]